MTKQDQNIKPFIQVVLGLGLLVIYELSLPPVRKIYAGTNHFGPADELGIILLHWMYLISGAVFFDLWNCRCF